MIANGLMESHDPVLYYSIVTLEIGVLAGAENGDSGILEMVVTSSSNAANRTGKISISLSVETLLKIEMELQDGEEDERDMIFGELGSSPKFKINLTNIGNVETEVRVFSSGNMRDWSVQITSSGSCEKDTNSDLGYDHGALLCVIGVGETIVVTAKVTGPNSEDGTIEDSFTFTLSAEPTELPEVVGRKNLELTVNGEPEPFGINSLITPNVLYGMSGVIIAGMLFMLFRRRI